MNSLHVSLATAVKVGATMGVVGATFLQPFRPMVVVGPSMEPTYHNDSLQLTRPVQEGDIKRGTVVVISMENGPIVKRIAYAPGDKIKQAKSGNLWLDVIYPEKKQIKDTKSIKWRDYAIPPGMVYVLGDNAAVSDDSRDFGCISTEQIERVLVDQRPNKPLKHSGY